MEKIIYIKSLIAKLVLNRDFTLLSYGRVNDSINSYKDVEVKSSFNHITVFHNKKQVALVRVSRKNVVVYYALDPNTLTSKYNIIDSSSVNAYKKYPSKFIIKTESDIEKAIEILYLSMVDKGEVKRVKSPKINYNKLYYKRTFDELLNAHLIKKYVRHIDELDNEVKEDIKVEESNDFIEKVEVSDVVSDEAFENNINDHKVTFKAKLKYDAIGEAKKLYVITNYNNWDLDKAIKMEKLSKDEFFAEGYFPAGYELKFKIVKSLNWNDVEKGIWREEIVDHHYTVNENIEVEDLIHSFKNMSK